MVPLQRLSLRQQLLILGAAEGFRTVLQDRRLRRKRTSLVLFLLLFRGFPEVTVKT